MSVTYIKRFRMHYDLRRSLPAPPALPAGYRVFPWSESLVYSHAQAKYESFKSELDANVFPCLGDADGCLKLMREISGRNNFIPEATWLLSFQRSGSRKPVYCGTVQGIRDQAAVGSIQNLGIAPEHRGKGLGTHLLCRALDGFQRVGLTVAALEVTAQNVNAYRLYHRFGFQTVRTVYKAIELVSS